LRKEIISLSLAIDLNGQTWTIPDYRMLKLKKRMTVL
jgi:hypothetical protein